MSKKGVLFAALAGIGSGTYGTCITLLNNMGLSETSIAICGSVMMLVFFLCLCLIKNPKALKLTKKAILIYLGVGIIGVIGSTFCYAMAITAGTPVAVASVLTFSNYYLVLIISRIVWKTRISVTKIISGLVCIAGIALILQVWTTLSITILGLMWMLTVIIAFATGNSLCNYAMEEGIDNYAYLFWTNLVSAVVLSFLMHPAGVISEISAGFSAHGILMLLGLLMLFVFPMVGQYVFLLKAFQNLEAPLVVVMYSLDPIVAAFLGFFVLGQSLAPVQFIGMAIIIAALIWLQMAERKEMKSAEKIEDSEIVVTEG